MALTLQTVTGIKNLLLSERITYKGSEIPALNSILNDIAIFEMEQNQSRAKLRAVTDLPPQPVGDGRAE